MFRTNLFFKRIESKLCTEDMAYALLSDLSSGGNGTSVSSKIEWWVKISKIFGPKSIYSKEINVFCK